MSIVKVQGNASGTGTLTIAAPNTNTDRTLTLPDQTATLITDSSGVLNIGSGQVYKDASGNVGIGTSSFASSARLQVAGGRSYFGSNDSVYAVQVAYNNTRALAGQGYYIGGTDSATPSLVFSNTDGTERARIDSSGNLLVGTTSTPNGTSSYGSGFINTTNSRRELYLATSLTTANNLARFYNPNGEVGVIQVSGTSTSYVTSSDHRLKENVQPMTGALAKVSALKPVTYKWKVDGSDGEGFIAHELQAVVPQCVTGEKDAVDADGNPQYQGIDTSFLVATLTAAIQELKAIVDTQGAEIAALKGQA